MSTLRPCTALSHPPMGNSYWSKTCTAQSTRQLSQQQQANYSSSIFAVSG